MYIKTAIDRFIDHLKANDRSIHTQTSYQRDLKKFTEWLKKHKFSMNVCSISPEIVSRFFTSKLATLRADGKPKKHSSINRSKLVLKSFFAFLEQAWFVKRSPARLLRCKRERRTITDILSASEKRKLLATVRSSDRPRAIRDAAILDLLMETGMRLDSLVHLNVTDINFKKRTILIRKMKGGGQTVKPLSIRLANQLRRYLSFRETLDSHSAALFLSCRGSRLCRRQVQRLIGGWIQKAGIRKHISCKSLRHTCASNLYRKTLDIVLVKEMLDHESILTTQLYTHVST